MSSAADRITQLKQLIAERRQLEEERSWREAEQLAELVELVRVEEEEKLRVEEQRRREEEEKRRAEELRVAREREEIELRKNAEALRLVVDDFEMHDAENLAETEAGSSDIAKDGDCLNCKVKRQERIRPR